MMFARRTPADAVRIARLDAGFYNPVFVENARKVESFAGDTITNLCPRLLDHSFLSIRTEDYQSNGVPFVRVKNLTGIVLDEDFVYISPEANERESQTICGPGDLLFAKTGKIAACPVPFHLLKVNTSQDVMVGTVRDGADPYYVAAFLNSRHGALYQERYVQGPVQPHLSLGSLRQIYVATPHLESQRYIGDKVRQAERLREKGKELERNLVRPFNSLVSEKVLGLAETRSWRVSGAALAARLDPGANHIRLATLRAELKSKQGVTALRNLIGLPISSGIGISDFTETGPLYVRIADFDSGYWDYSAAAVAQKDHEANDQARVQPGDVVFARIGNTLGKVGFADSFVPPSSISNNCSLLRPTSPTLGPWVFWSLRSRLGQIQVNCLRSQTAQPKIAHEDIEEIVVPLPDAEKVAVTAAATESRFRHARMSDGMVSASRLLVEALIEGKISESELISAQQALERGDRSADRAILQRLTRKGVDAPGAPPLFPDVDALYALLDSLDRPETAQ